MFINRGCVKYIYCAMAFPNNEALKQILWNISVDEKRYPQYIIKLKNENYKTLRYIILYLNKLHLCT